MKAQQEGVASLDEVTDDIYDWVRRVAEEVRDRHEQSKVDLAAIAIQARVASSRAQLIEDSFDSVANRLAWRGASSGRCGFPPHGSCVGSHGHGRGTK